MHRFITNTVFLGIIFSAFVIRAGAQEAEDQKSIYHFNGNVSITNNGFSLIPSFSLGKPAAVAILSVGGERFSLDPQFRFDLEGFKPWTFVFMWRYNLVNTDKVLIRPGLHFPALSFREQEIEINGEPRESTIPYRYFTPELTASYMPSAKVGIGLYYLYGLGLEEQDQTRNMHFISLRAYLNRIFLGDQFYFNWNPQVYYLNMDGTVGYYAAQSLELGHWKWPVSISSMMNVKLKSDIDTKDFDWNISLIYSFGGQFSKGK